MKKPFAVILAAVLLISFSGCNRVAKPPRNLPESSGESSFVYLPDSDPAPEDIFGRVDGKVYTNDFLGIKLVAPAKWQAFSNKQLVKLSEVGGIMGNDAAQSLESLIPTCALALMDIRENLGVIVIVQDISENIAWESITEDSFLDFLINFAPDSGETLQRGEVVIAGETYKTIEIALDGNVQKHCVRKIGSYMAIFMCTYAEEYEAEVENLLALFEAL